MNVNSEESGNESNHSNQPIKKRPPRKPPMDNVSYIEAAKKEMQLNAPYLKLYREVSGISVQKMCEDCGISHATWENLEKGADTKQSTHCVYIDHLFINSGRILHLPVITKHLTLAQVNREKAYIVRRGEHEEINDPTAECIFDFLGSEYSAEETMQMFDEHKEQVAREKEKQKEKQNEETEDDDE